MINATQQDLLNSIENGKGEFILTITRQTKNHSSIPREIRDVRCKRYQIITTYKLEEISYRNPMTSGFHHKWMKKPIKKNIIPHYE